MHIMPSDANCISTTNNVYTDSIYYEKKISFLSSEIEWILFGLKI